MPERAACGFADTGGKVILAATILQFAVAMLAGLRAWALWTLPRRAAQLGFSWPSSSERPWLLAAVMWMDVVNDWANRGINSVLPAPNGAPLVGLARAGAHLGLALYAAWVCGIFAYAGWLARHRLPKYAAIAVILWLFFVATNVVFYDETRGDTALRALGTLHICAFAGALPCLLVFAQSRGDRLGTERICAVWLIFLGLAAGIGPLRPWESGQIDRAVAERFMAVAMVALYGSIITTILVGGVRWIWSFTRYGRWRSRLSG